MDDWRKILVLCGVKYREFTVHQFLGQSARQLQYTLFLPCKRHELEKSKFHLF